jgi:ABC-type bacteriocin/lantibiotic exporter with double-glycine peptidase domain
VKISNQVRSRLAAAPASLPSNIFRYVLIASGVHQLLLLALGVSLFLLEIVPLELQRRIINDLVKGRPYSWVVTLGAAYAGVGLVQGGIKLVLNACRGWIGERAIRDLRGRIYAVSQMPPDVLAAVEAQGNAVSMIVAEVEPIGGFVGGSISEPLLQGGILATVLAYLVHLDQLMALAALALFIPQFLFVPPLQAAVNRRAGARVLILRQLGSGVIDRVNGNCRDDGQWIDRIFALDMGVFFLKFTMNFLINFCCHLQIIAAMMIGGWWVYEGQLEIGGVVAFISGIGKLNDSWGELVGYFREINVNQVKYCLLANAVNQLTKAAEA